MEKVEKEFLSIAQLTERYGLPSKNWAYQRSRRNGLPGQRRIGRYVRIDVAEFDAAVKAGMLA